MSRISEFEKLWKKQKEEEVNTSSSDITNNINTGNDNDFTLEKYKEMKKKGQVIYDTDIVDSYFNLGKSYVDSVAKDVSDPTYNWANSNASDYSDLTNEINGKLDYVKLYINSLKGTDKYDALLEQYNSYNDAINNSTNAVKDAKDYISQFSNESELNQAKYDKKYKGYDYSMLKAELDKTDSESDSSLYSYLKDKSHEIATSEDIQKEIEALDKEFGELTQFDEKDDIRREEIEDEWETLEALKEEKEYEEEKQKNYTDVLQNDVRAWTTLQQYYALQKADETEEMLKATGHDIDSVKVQSTIDSYNFAKALSQDEKEKIINDFENLDNKDELYKYFVREQEEKESAEENTLLQDYAEENPVMGSLASVSLNTYGSVSDAVKHIGAGVDSTFGGDGYINPDTTNVAKAQVIRDTVSEDMGGLGKFLYNTGMSMGDFISVLPASVIPYIGQATSLALLGTSSGVSAANTVIENGGDIGHAITTGVFAGGAEAFFERFSLGSLKALKSTSSKNILGVVTNVLKQSGVEASEEGFTELANGLTDWLINADLSNWSIQYDNYLKRGYSEEEAWKMTVGNFASQVGLSMAGGAVSGGIMGAGASAIGYASNKINVTADGKSIKSKENVSSLIKTAKTLSTDSKAYKLATKLEQQQKNGKEITSSKVGELRSLIIEQSKADYDTAYKDVTKNLHAEEIAIIDKIIRGESLTPEEMSVVNDNTALSKSIQKIKSATKQQFVNSTKAELAPFTSIDNNAIDKSKLNISKNGVTEINGKEYTGAMEVVRTNPDTGVVTYKIEEDGKEVEVSSEELGFGSFEDAYLNSVASKYNTQTAQKLIEFYEEGQDVEDYATEFNLYQNYGRLAIPLTDDKMSNGHVMNNDQKLGAYEVGMDSRKSYYQTQTVIANNMKNSKHYAYKEGKFNVSAIKGIKLNETQKVFYNFLREFALRTGINIELFASEVVDGEYVGEQGSFDKNTGTIRIDINAGLKKVNKNDIKHGMLNTFAHELTHVAELGGFYDELHEAVVKAFEKQDESFDNLVEDKKQKILDTHPNAKNMSEEKLAHLADTEVIADACETMLKDSKIFEDIIQGNPSLAQKIKNALRDFINRLKEMLGSMKALTTEGAILEKCVDDLEQIQNLWDKAVTSGIKTLNATKSEQKNNTDLDDDVKYSIRYTTNNIPVVVVNDNIISHLYSSKDIIKTVKKSLGRFKRVPIKGQNIYFVSDTKSEFVGSKYTKWLNKNDKQTYYDKMRVAGHPQDIVYATTKYINEGLKHERKDNIVDFARGEILIDVSGRKYLANAVIGFTKSGICELHDIVNMNSTSFEYKKEVTPKGMDSKESTRSGATSNIRISQDDANVNIQSMKENKKYSLRDNEYLKAVKNNDMETAQRLVDEAAEKAFFNSKIRDDDGKLIKVYHGTDADFTVFDKTKGRTNMDIQGMFFSPWEIDAKGYGPNVRVFYLNITNPANESTGYKALHMFVRQNKAGVKAREHLVSLGYDGVNNEDEEFIAFNSNQIKSADPVTYDDNGNVIPLSERFKDNQTDIRYQMRTDGTYSNRTLLENALESSVQNEVERNLIKAYKEGVSQLDEMEAKLGDVKAKIKEISFTKNSDRSQLLKLNNQKKMLTNKIAQKDKQLLNLESMESMQKLIALEKDKAIKRAKKKMDQVVREVKEQEREKAKKLVLETRERYQKTLQEVREGRDKKLIAEREKRKDQIKKFRNSKERAEYIEKIRKLQKKFTQMALRPNDKSFVIPDCLNNGFLEACKIITDAVTLDSNTKAGEALGKISNTIDELIANNDTEFTLLSDEFSSDFKELVVALRKSLLNKKIDKNLTLAEAEDIYSIMNQIYYTVRDANKMLSREDAITISESSEKMIDELGKVKENKGVLSKGIMQILNPVRVAQMHSGYSENSELMNHIYNLDNGEIKASEWDMNARKPFEALEKSDSKAYDRSVTEVVTIEYIANNGEAKTVKLTRIQGMQILLSWEREAHNQKLVHMQTGGIVIPDAELMAKSKFKEAYDNKQTIKGVNYSLMTAIADTMTDFDWLYMGLAKKYFNEVSKKAINEVSLKLKHREVATESNYIPFSVDNRYLATEYESVKFDTTLENTGKLKSLVVKDSKPIVIAGLNNVLDRDISDTARLYGLAVPLRDFKKSFKLTSKDNVTMADGTLKTVSGESARGIINDKWGEEGSEFYDKLVSDLTTERKSEKAPFVEPLNKLRKAKITSVFTANLSITIKQLSAYPSALLHLSHKALAQGLLKTGYIFKNWDTVCEEIDSHTPLHYKRRKGLSSREMTEFLNTKLSKKMKRMPSVLNPTKWIQCMDYYITAMHWEACKAEVASKIEVGTDEYWSEVTNLYNKVINDTQQNYDVMHTAEVTKSKNGLWENLFIFRTEPLQHTGVLYEAVMEYSNTKSEKSKSKLVKAIASQIESAFLYAGLGFVVALLLHKLNPYKDEDDEITPKSVLTRIGTDVFENIAGLIAPIGGESVAELISALVTGENIFDTELMVIQTINDLKDVFYDVPNTILSIAYKLSLGLDVDFTAVGSEMWDSVKTVLEPFGVPLQNTENIFTAIPKWTGAIPDSTNKPSSIAKQYGNAYISGNTEKAKEKLVTLYQQKLEEYRTENETNPEKKARNSVRDTLSNAYKKEYQEAFLRNDTKRMQEIVSLLQSSGYMKWENQLLSEKLSDWRKSAKDDLSE